MDYFQVWTGAESPVQRSNLLNHLIVQRLAFRRPAHAVTGPGGCDVAAHDCGCAKVFTRGDLKEALIREVERVSTDEACMISFLPVEGDRELSEMLDIVFPGQDPTRPPAPRHALAPFEGVAASKPSARRRRDFRGRGETGPERPGFTDGRSGGL